MQEAPQFAGVEKHALGIYPSRHRCYRVSGTLQELISPHEKESAELAPPARIDHVNPMEDMGVGV
jgi:hypothetical protein